MIFEWAKVATAEANNEQEFETILQEQMVSGTVSEERMREATEKLFPGTNVMVDDPVKRQAREALSQRMRDVMGNYLRNNFHAVQAQQAWLSTQPEPSVQLSRPLSADTLLKLPRPDQLEEYKRRYNILMNGTAKEKTDLLFEALNEAKQGYTRQGLIALSNEEIANDFENLERLQGFVNAARNLCNEPMLELSEEQKQELLDFETEFDGISNVFTRAKLISSPSYGMVDVENLPERNDAILLDTSPENEEIEKLFNAADNARNFTQPYMESEVKRRMGADIAAEEITWLNDRGEPVDAFYNAYSEKYFPPVQELTNGGSLTGVLPDGTIKIVQVEPLPGGGLTVHDRPATASEYAADADILMTSETKKLFSAMDAADPWYVHSSSEFKAVKAELDKMQKEYRALGNNPTQYQRESLLEQLKALDDLSSAYIGSKQAKTSFNDRETARLEAMKAVSSFAKKQMNLLDKLSEAMGKEVNTPEKAAFAQAYSAQERAANQDNITTQAEQTARFERPDTMTNGVQKDMEQRNKEYLERFAKAGAYKNISCPPSQECGNALENLHNSLNASLERLLTASTHTMLRTGEKAILLEDMARLTVFHLVLTERERSGNRFDGHAGPIEKALAADTEGLVSSMAKNPQFAGIIGEITPSRVDQFLRNDGARMMGKALIEQSRQNQAQAAAAPENSAQKNMENPMQKR